jgi:ubiquinone/menaquinone biosynthesis C-methylase UbiE
MREQIDALDIKDQSRVLDLGCGIGDFAVQLATDHDHTDITIDAVDFVQDALYRAVSRVTALRNGSQIRLNPILSDFDLGSGESLPLKPESYDAVLVSLVVSYVSNPHSLLAGVRSALRPRGRLVLSTLKRDADISRLHVEGMAELRAGRAEEEFGSETAEAIDEMARDFLNDASRILDLEEDGTFRFWDLDELARLVQSAGFTIERSFYSLGDPPQAAVLVAHRD